MTRYRQVEPSARKVRRLRRHRADGEPIPEGELATAEREFKKLISRRKPYTMLVRSLFGDLQDLFD